MAKTFNPNRVGGGSVSIVRAADGTYSLKETGFDQISSLNMVDLGAIATTTTAAKTETATDKTGTSVEDQTKQAFLLPKQDRGDDPFTTEKLLKSATDVSKGLSEVETVSDRQKTESQLGATEGPTVGSFGQDPTAQIKDPTESVFGRSTVSQEQLQRQDLLPETKVETPQEKLKVTSANVQKGLVEPPLKDKAVGFFNKYIAGEKTKINTEKGSEVTQAGQNVNVDTIAAQDQAAKTATQGMGVDPTKMVPQMGSLGISPTVGSFGQDPTSLGISADPSRFAGSTKGTLADPLEKQDFIATPAKRTFAQSVNTALKGVGEAVQFISPVMGVVKALGTPRNESASTVAFNKNKFNIVTSPGAMQGRIVGNDGSYDPANNLFHGMNRTSAFGNLEKAGQKRIDRIEKTIAKKKARGQDTSVLEKRANDFRGELTEYRNEKNNHNINSAKKKGVDTTKLNPNEMRNVAETGDPGGNGGGGKSIVCTAMYQTTGLQDWAKAMKIWYIYQKRYLTIQHQEGYHKLFKPFVKAMHKSNIVKAIGAHFAKHRTQHLKHVLFKSKPSLLGKVYSKVLETICYWAGKK